jgi:hypothetical protein
MVPDFVRSLQNEEARLETELKRSPLFRQLEAVRESLRKLMPAYEGSGADAIQAASSLAGNGTLTADAIVVPASSQQGRTERAGSMSSIVSQAALKLFRETGKRAKSSIILEILAKNGVQIDNKKPQAQVASILSHNPLFDNTGDARGSGYGLREWSQMNSAGESETATLS